VFSLQIKLFVDTSADTEIVPSPWMFQSALASGLVKLYSIGLELLSLPPL
jgi:hypothetical protein